MAQTANNKTEPIIDSDLSFEQAVDGLEFPEKIRNRLALVNVRYFGFDGKIHVGQLVVYKDLSKEIKEIFERLLKIKFPVRSVIPIVKFGWDDEKSMSANNTSAFNYRLIKGTKKLSKHSYGIAIDINPLFNPYVKRNSTEPEGAEYIPERPGTITRNSPVVKIFSEYGWDWGGNWTRGKDYQHFEKNDFPVK